jgi:hypothetical protein
MRSSTPTLIAALRILANDIQSEDGVANAAIAEAADRLQELNETLQELCDFAEPTKHWRYSDRSVKAFKKAANLLMEGQS